MTDLLADGVQWLGSQLSESASRAITYTRGDVSDEMMATVGQSMHEKRDQHGVVTRIKTRDYLINATELLLDGEPITPQRDDLITEVTPGGVTITCRVLPAGVDPCWRWSDAACTRMRIHTKEQS